MAGPAREAIVAATGLEEHELHMFVASLQDRQRIEEVHIFESALTDENVLPLLTALEPHAESLLKLKLQATALGEPLKPLGRQTMETMADFLRRCVKLRKIQVSCGIADALLVPVVRALADCKEIRYLELCQNDLGTRGCAAMAILLPLLPELRTLSLWSNQIGDAAMESLAGALPSCSRLIELLLADNIFGPHGARKLAEALPRMENLEVLYACWAKRAEEAGHTALVDCIDRCPKLRSFVVTDACVTEGTARQMAVNLARSGSLQLHTLEGADLRNFRDMLKLPDSLIAALAHKRLANGDVLTFLRDRQRKRYQILTCFVAAAQASPTLRMNALIEVLELGEEDGPEVNILDDDVDIRTEGPGNNAGPGHDDTPAPGHDSSQIQELVIRLCATPPEVWAAALEFWLGGRITFQWTQPLAGSRSEARRQAKKPRLQ